ncbi:MAG: hypothetical protein R3F22_01265 [Lysobacteraceae bacterium]
MSAGRNQGEGRALRLAIALVVWVLLTLLAWAIYAAPRWTGFSGEQRELPLSSFEASGGELTMGDGALRLDIPAATARTMFWTSGPWQAADFRFLRIELEDLGKERELRLWWRRDGKPQSVAIPRAGDVVTLDLPRASEQWSGEIEDLAIEVRPIDLIAPNDVPETTLTLREVSLVSDGYAPALWALADEWAAQRRWIGRSINTAGLEMGFEHPRPWLPAFLLSALLLLPLLGWALRWQRGGWLQGAAVITFGLWLLLDLQSLRVQAARAARVATVHDMAGEHGLDASPALARPLKALRDQLLAEPSPPTVFLHANSTFLRDYPMFLLRPLNVGPLPRRSEEPLPVGSIVLAMGEPLELKNGRLRVAGANYRVEEISRVSGMQVLRLGDVIERRRRSNEP